ncbi:MAG: histidinol phosphate phosphatase domain-containing protein [Deltaproteobacteria bacterium]|nr:histidinol phosphate phosphatase domain-containing protein [Deltaproteobacteria bacterium]
MIDLHTHTLFSDGVLIPAELARRAEVAGYRAIAFTDHADHSNIEQILHGIVNGCKALNERGSLRAIPGVEITHVHPDDFAVLVRRARKSGAQIIVAHGETLVEPVRAGTNRAAIEAGVDILAHPGLITEEEVKKAGERGVLLEITTRKGHSLSNGHVASLAVKFGVPLVCNTDSHAPGDLVTKEMARRILQGAGLHGAEVKKVFEHSERFINELS